MNGMPPNRIKLLKRVTQLPPMLLSQPGVTTKPSPTAGAQGKGDDNDTSPGAELRMVRRNT